MPRKYSEEEKQELLDKFKVSGKSKTEYARENGIPEATFRAWVKEETYANYGVLDISISEQAPFVYRLQFQICISTYIL